MDKSNKVDEIMIKMVLVELLHYTALDTFKKEFEQDIKDWINQATVKPEDQAIAEVRPNILVRAWRNLTK